MKRHSVIHQIEPWIDDLEKQELIKTIDSTWITEGKRTHEFEAKISKLTGARWVLALNNGTTSLTLSMIALGLAKGDEVLVPDVTFIATSNAVIFAGGTPVFVDINQQTLQIDVNALDRHLTKRTVGIIPVHLYGLCVDMDPLMAFAKKHHLWVLEDAAQAIGVHYKGRQAGTIGDIGIFSFYGNKVVTTGEGGCILTNNTSLYKKVYSLSHEGREKGNFISKEFGMNFCFTDLQAAVGLAQLRKLKRIVSRKRAIECSYRQQLSRLREVQFPQTPSFCEPTFWFTNIFVPDVLALSAYLRNHGVETRRIFPPLHMQPCYSKHPQAHRPFPHAQWVYSHGLSLPSSATLTKDALSYICERIEEFYS